MLTLAQPADACVGRGAVCDWILDLTGSTVMARSVDLLAGPLLRVAFVLTITFLMLAVVRRLIQRMAARAKAGGGITRLRGLVLDPSSTIHPRKAQRADALAAVVLSIITVVVWAIAFMTILGTFDVDLAPMIAGAGVIGLAVGFGAQNLVKDFLAGMFMLAEDQFGVGDVIDVGEAIGTVEGMSLRTTRIRDVHGSLWHVPNGEIHRVANMSQDWARTLIDVSVAYETDVDRAAALILAVAQDVAGDEPFAADFLEEPEIWGVQALGADSVDIRLVIKTVPGAQWALGRELRRRIKYALDEAGIEIPFPQRTVWLRTERDQPDQPAGRRSTPVAAPEAEAAPVVSGGEPDEAPEPPGS